MRISIIIPAYNAEKYIGKMIESINNQSYTGQIEIIVAYDTKSTDYTLAVLCDLVGKSRHVIKICSDNDTSIGAARNRGLKLATSELIYFADADDCLARNCVQNIINAFNNNPNLDAVTFKWKITTENTSDKYIRKYAKSPVCNRCDIVDKITLLHGLWCSRKYTICAWGYVFKRSFIEKHDLHFPDYSSGEDQIYVISGIVNTSNIGFIPVVNYVYIIHDSSASHKERSTEKFWNDHIQYRHDYFSIMGDRYPSVESIAYLDYYRWFLFESTKFSYDEYKRVIDSYGIRTLPIVLGTSITHVAASLIFNFNHDLYYHISRLYRKVKGK